jgi:hypothetical protein
MDWLSINIIKTTPATEATIKKTCRRLGFSRRIKADRIATKMGIAAIIIPEYEAEVSIIPAVSVEKYRIGWKMASGSRLT